MKKPIIAIIGGKGEMGGAFARLFRNHGCRVLIADRATALSPRKAAIEADITLVSVPISVTPRVIKNIAPHLKPGSLLTDVTSLKAPFALAAKKHAPRSVEILGMHPLFGPSMVSRMKKQVIAVSSLRSGPLSKWLMDFFESKGALLRSTTPEKHDTVMAVIQGITHFSAIASGMALKKLGVNLHETLAFASPIYQMRLAMIGRILGQSSQLYAEIEIENPKTLAAVRAYKKSIAQLCSAIEGRGVKQFRKYFDEAARYLGSFKGRAQKETDEIIRFMSESMI